MVNSAITNTAIVGVPSSQAGVAAAIASTSRQVGTALGVAAPGGGALLALPRAPTDAGLPSPKPPSSTVLSPQGPVTVGSCSRSSPPASKPTRRRTERPAGSLRAPRGSSAVMKGPAMWNSFSADAGVRMTAEVITYPGGNGDEIHAWLARPDGDGPKPGSWPSTASPGGAASTGS